MQWGSGRIVGLFWELDRDVVNVLTENGKLLQFDINCQLTRQLTICNEEILEGRAFHVLDKQCLVYLTTTCRFYYMADNNDPNRIIDLGQLRQAQLPDSWSVVKRHKSLQLIAAFGSICLTRRLDEQRGQVSTNEIRLSKNYNSIQTLASSLTGNLLVASTDVGIHSIIDSETLEPLSELNTSAKITAPPLQACFVSNKPPVVALLWSHLLLIVDAEKHWVRYDLDEVTYISAEHDGLRMVSGTNHAFLALVDASTSAIYSPSAPGSLLVDAFHLFTRDDERAEEIVSVLRHPNNDDSCLLPQAIGQCTLAATTELSTRRQKELLSAASFGKTLTDEVDAKLFSRTIRILRVLNHLRRHCAMSVTYQQFVRLSPFGLIERLLARGQHKLGWHVAEHLQLIEENPNIKDQIVSSWAAALIRQSRSDNHQSITTRIRNRTRQLGVSVNFIDIAKQAAECAQIELAYALIECEPRHRPRVELLLKIDATGERALKTALESHDPDLIYLCLLHIHQKTSPEGYEAVLKQYPQAARQYAIYCRQNGKMSRFTSQRDETFHLAMVQLTQATSGETLATAAKTFKTAGADFAARAIEQHRALLTAMGDEGHTKSTLGTLRQLLNSGDFVRAEQIKKDMRFNEAHFARLKLNALGEQGAFGEIEKMGKAKRPPCPFEHFIKVCIKAKRPDEAEKYLDRLQGKQRIAGLLQMGRYVDAAGVANQSGDIDLVEKCYNQAQRADPAAAAEIAQLYS